MMSGMLGFSIWTLACAVIREPGYTAVVLNCMRGSECLIAAFYCVIAVAGFVLALYDILTNKRH